MGDNIASEIATAFGRRCTGRGPRRGFSCRLRPAYLPPPMTRSTGTRPSTSTAQLRFANLAASLGAPVHRPAQAASCPRPRLVRGSAGDHRILAHIRRTRTDPPLRPQPRALGAAGRAPTVRVRGHVPKRCSARQRFPTIEARPTSSLLPVAASTGSGCCGRRPPREHRNRQLVPNRSSVRSSPALVRQQVGRPDWRELADTAALRETSPRLLEASPTCATATGTTTSPADPRHQRRRHPTTPIARTRDGTAHGPSPTILIREPSTFRGGAPPARPRVRPVRGVYARRPTPSRRGRWGSWRRTAVIVTDELIVKAYCRIGRT